MRPVLFELGDVRIYSHGFVLGLLICLAVLVYEARRRRWPADEVVPITLCAFVGGILGARLAMLVFAGWNVAATVFDYFALFDASVGPGSVLGGVAGAYAGGYLASRSLGARCTCDAFAPAMALGMAGGGVRGFLSGGGGLRGGAAVSRGGSRP